MALDRFVYWKRQKPTRKQVIGVAKNFFGDAALIKDGGDRLFVTLPGTTSDPTAGLKHLMHDPVVGEKGERWIEVYIDTKYVDVITRMADPYTNALAAGLAELYRRYWQGELQDD